MDSIIQGLNLRWKCGNWMKGLDSSSIQGCDLGDKACFWLSGFLSPCSTLDWSIESNEISNHTKSSIFYIHPWFQTTPPIIDENTA